LARLAATVVVERKLASLNLWLINRPRRAWFLTEDGVGCFGLPPRLERRMPCFWSRAAKTPLGVDKQTGGVDEYKIVQCLRRVR
jgi:hypothetical protein